MQPPIIPQLLVAPAFLPGFETPVNNKANYTSGNDQTQDHYCAVKEEGIRKDGNDRIRIRAEDPIVIVKENVVESNKCLIPV